MSDTEIPQGQQVYRRILEDIRTGRLGPGHRLRETELATQMNQSRTPVREALRLLETDGLVTHLPRVGAVIRSLSYSEVMELYEMRCVLESTAARLAAITATEAEMTQLCALNAEFGNETCEDAAAVLNRSFHTMLFEAARNRFLRRAVRGLQKSMYLLGPSTLREPQRTPIAAGEHEQILAAIRMRDSAAAAAAMRAHMEAAQGVRLRALTAARHTAGV